MKRCNSTGKTAIILVFLIALLCWPVTCLIAETGEAAAGRVVSLFPESLKMTFIHSMYHQPQTSHYVIEGNKLILKQVDFYSYDELAYFYPETADRYKPDTDGIWRVPFNIVLEKEVIRQSHIQPYALAVNGRSYHGLDTVPGDTRLQFRLQKIPAGLAVWKCWFAGNN